ncbi:MAG: polymer-forming cytoskeletal protein [Thermodesulfobacteriota bacterium]
MSQDREPAPAAAGQQPGERFKHEIAADVAISGRITFPGNARIDGRLSGEVRADALLVVGPSAVLRANVRAQQLVVFGTIEGDVRQSESVELKPGCRVIGNLEARRVTVHAGAVFEGRCMIGKRPPAAAATLHADDVKRHA